MKLNLLLLLFVMGATLLGQAAVTKKVFGKMPDGTPVDIYTLKDGKIEATITTYGGIIVSLKTPDRTGKVEDIALGFDSLDGYVTSNKPFMGAIIGRYANRIAHGTFELNGKKYSIPKNDGDNALHGGLKGFDKVVWQGKTIKDGVELTYVSKDGEEGFPGTLKATVQYTLKDGELKIDYSATTDKDTVVNLTNHSYFNLAGQNAGSILKHVLKINASRYSTVDQGLIPEGAPASVEGTPFDFRKPTEVGARIDDPHVQIQRGRGYDHNWVLDHPAGELALAAEMYEPTHGRVLQVLTDQPGVQFYTGNFLDGTVTGKGGTAYQKRTGFCLETQHYPDSPNQPAFPTTELKPGQRYHTVTIFKFSAK